jgi:hypothetical protein
MKAYVWRRLWEVLQRRDTSGKFWRLTPSDRQAIFEILRDTTPDLPSYWKEYFSVTADAVPPSTVQGE